MQKERPTYHLFYSVTFVSLLFIMSLFSSCINDHCNENLYAPLNITFYSELDTSVQATPSFLLIQGVGTDSLINASWLSNVNVTLDATKQESYFAMTQSTSTELLRLIQLSKNTFITEDSSQFYTLDKVINESIHCFNGDFEQTCILAATEDSLFTFVKLKFDTLKITYNVSLEFVSAECGCMNTYTLKSADFTHKGFGSTLISNSLINSQSNEKHIRIYLENY